MSDNHAQRISFARSQLESGLKPTTVALRLQVHFNISRATAYRDVVAADDETTASDDGPSSDELAAPVDSADLVTELLYDARRCMAAGDFGNGCKLIAAADKVKRWHGQGGPEPPGWA